MNGILMNCKGELLGVVQKTSKNNNVYYIFNFIDENGTPFNFCCKDSTLLTDLQKRELYDLVVSYSEDKYGKKIDLVGLSKCKK